MYDAANIANIKRTGQLEAYIDMERDLIAKLAGAKVHDVEDGKIAIAHLIGYYGIAAEGLSEPHAVADLQTSGWSKQWRVAGFASQKAATAYAKAAVTNALQRQAADVLAKARERLAALEAAQ